MKLLRKLVLIASLATPLPALAADMDATLYKNLDCYCCELYGQYLDKNGYEMNVVTAENLAAIKQQLGVPAELAACHTTVIGDYLVEGHVPVESVDRLLEEKPGVKGIAVPGMPAGSPGMGGEKSAPITVYSFEDSAVPKVYEAI